MIDEIRAKYRNIRRQVYEQATLPVVANETQHAENQSRIREGVETVCNRANLAHWSAATDDARRALWNHLWTKNRYAGIRAQIATTEITQLTPLFDDYNWFCDPGWDIESKGHTIHSAGSLARNFLERTGPFATIQTIGNIPKLKKIVAVARHFKRFFDEHPNAAAIDFVTRNLKPDDTWAVHDQLMEAGYTADLTALHFMMDVGFQVIKPDIVISRLFLDWGWLHYALPALPADITRADLSGKGNYSTRYLYTKPIIYKPVINLAREIVRGIERQELVADIGWATINPIREFDIFVVKSGQLPEIKFGIERRLYS
jgi:hypothetical protein